MYRTRFMAPRVQTLFQVAATAATLLLASCGGGGGGGSSGGSAGVTSAEFVTTTAGIIEKNESLIIRFDDSVNAGSLVLGGILAAEAAGSWSKTRVENDTYTLVPRSGKWRAGPRLVTVSAEGAQGGKVSNVQAKFVVPLDLSSSMGADVAIGQPDLRSGEDNAGGTTSSRGLQEPYGNAVPTPEGQLYVVDSDNLRILHYDQMPAASNAAAVFALGQPDLQSNAASRPSRGSFGYPTDASSGGGKFAVADAGWNRVVIYNTLPKTAAALPDVVVGQSAFTTSSTGCDAKLLNEPLATDISSGRLIVVDRRNSRVLIWHKIPELSGQVPDVVLGQNTFSTCMRNDDDQNGVDDGQPSARTLRRPEGVWTDGERLAVADTGNNRVLIWSKFPTSNFQPADIVLGQSSLHGWAANDDNQDSSEDNTPTARTLDGPRRIASNGVQLAVADSNNRVLVWNRFPASNFQPADRVLGQASFTENYANGSSGRVTEKTLYGPHGVAFHQDTLLVTDTNNARVLVFKSN